MNRVILALFDLHRGHYCLNGVAVREVFLRDGKTLERQTERVTGRRYVRFRCEDDAHSIGATGGIDRRGSLTSLYEMLAADSGAPGVLGVALQGLVHRAVYIDLVQQ